MNILRKFQFATQSSGRFFSLRRGAPHLSVIGRGWNKLGLAVLLPLVSLSLLSAAASGQAAAGEGSKGLITGTVVDSGGSVVKGAQLELEPLGVTVSTDDQGAFSFPMVPAGSYTVKLSAAGFATQETKVELVAGKTAELDLKLAVGSNIEQILVTAERPHGEMEALDESRAADNIQQILPAEVIVSLPNANVADAIGRLPSVSLQRLEGEGEYIEVRGTEPRLTNITIDGITVPSPEPLVRQVRLDIIPSDMVEHVDINKTLSANMDAEGIGSSVELTVKEAQEKPTINVFLNGGRTNILNGRYNAASGGTFGERLLKSKKLGVLGNVAFDFNGRGIDNYQPQIDPLSTMAQPFYDNNTMREYRYYRYRYGYSGSADYKFNDVSSIFVRGFYSQLKDWGDKWYYEPVSTPLTTTGVYPSTSANSPSPKFYTSSKRPNASIGTLMLGGREIHPSNWLVWEAAVSRSFEQDSAGNPKADFAWIGPSLQCNYGPQGATFFPQFGACSGATSPLENANDFVFKDITYPDPKGLSTQLNLTGEISDSQNYTFHGHFGIIEAGFKISNAHKLQDATETVYDGWGTKASTPGVAAYSMAALQGYFNNTDYFKGEFMGGKFGPVSDFNRTTNFVLTNFSADVDGYKTALDNWPNLFGIIERVSAGYVMNTIDVARLHVQAGVRFEQTTMRTHGHNVTLYAAGASQCGGPTNTGCGVPSVVTNNPSYFDAFPDINMRYKITDDQGLRIVYGRGIARPDPYQLIPYITYDESANPPSFTVGDPSLHAEHANNYDVLYEHFLKPIGMIQAGVFYKQLTAPQLLFTIPIGTNLAALPPGSIPPLTLANIEQDLASGTNTGGAEVTQYISGTNSRLYGVELSYQQHLTFLPGVLAGIGITANYGYQQSKIKSIPLRNDHPRLIDQPNNTWNLSPTYDTKRFSARAGLTYNGSSVFSYNWISPVSAPGAGADPSGLGPKGPSGDIWTLPHYQADVQASYRFFRGLSVQASVLNLNNEVYGYYQGSPQFVNQREFYKPSYDAGIRYVFGHD
jgi:TonB-dependent receptor